MVLGPHSDPPVGLLRPALLLDRDGTLIRDGGYTCRLDQLEWMPGAVEALRLANAAGWLTIVVTNQSGVARGYFSAADVEALHDEMQRKLAEVGARIDAFYYCPYHPDGIISELAICGHPDRKPGAGMLRRAVVEWGIDTSRSWMLGDKPSDVLAGQAAGMGGRLVEPGSLLPTAVSILSEDRTAVPLDQPDFGPMRTWLFDVALPRWAAAGYDSSSRTFQERLDLAGKPIIVPRRTRVQARQLFVYARAGVLGWNGPWRALVEAGLDTLLSKALRPDGGTRHLLTPDGMVADDSRDLCDVAFILLALAQAAVVLPYDNRPLMAARKLSDWLDRTWTHSSGGYFEGDIVSSDRRRQNPHMHLLEAYLALFEVSGDPSFGKQATKLACLGRDKLFQPATGTIPEYFDENWSPLPESSGGVLIEPGHQFEWSYLFRRAGQLLEGDWSDVARTLLVNAEIYGVDPVTGMIFEEILSEGRPVTRSSRLWAHAERAKANIAAISCGGNAIARQAAAQAGQCLMEYANAAGPGLWLERRDENGKFLGAEVLASSFYNIMGATEAIVGKNSPMLLGH